MKTAIIKERYRVQRVYQVVNARTGEVVDQSVNKLYCDIQATKANEQSALKEIKSGKFDGFHNNGD